MPANASSPDGPHGRRESASELAVKPRTHKACINCRRQKMKCIAGNGSTCRRCHRSGLPCIFVPRANAAILPEVLVDSPDGQFKSEVLRRLQLIEESIGLAASGETAGIDASDCGNKDRGEESPDGHVLSPLWKAIGVLERNSPRAVPSIIWQKSTVESLWSSFHDRMPGLHFMPDKQTFSSPQPLLLASILYCSSTRGGPDVAGLAPHYFAVLCNAIGQLSIPGNEIGLPPDTEESAEEWAFQSVLGLVLAGLLNEANVRETGIWISLAYRLILENCPAHVDETPRDWRKLFSGLQIIDLEHASLHLSCPVIPIESPLVALRTSHRDQLYRLSRMMHTGLSHFTGRRLPTIWSCFQGESFPSNGSTISFTAVDAAVIRDWARQLDDWLVEFSNGGEGSEQSRIVVFRQYVLHRLLVLSIYHPARGCNLWSNYSTPGEQHELLVSARATLKLHLHDSTIWSNWDLVMITWAALIVIQGVEGYVGEPDDLRNIRIHLELLKQLDRSKPSLCDKLIYRLEGSLNGVSTPDLATVQQAEGYPPANPNLDYSWQIFDQVSLQQMNYAN